MYLNLFLAVDESQYVVARDRMTTIHKLILVDIVVGDVDWFLAVEFIRDGKQLFSLSLLQHGSVLFLVAEERYEFSPSLRGSFLLITDMYFVDVLVREQYSLVANSLEEVLALIDVVERSNLVGYLYSVVNAMSRKE